MRNAKSFVTKDSELCGHSTERFSYGRQGMDNDQFNRQSRVETVGSFSNA